MATIEDVAKRAGVAASTVSYVLSGKRSISAATRTKVQTAIAELGYHPHAGARALASARTNVLALMVPLPLLPGTQTLRPDIDVNVLMQFVAGIAPRARALGYDVLLLTDDDPGAAERVWAGSTADAIITMSIQAEDPRVEALSRAQMPAILIGLPDDPHGLSCVDFDFENAGRLAIRHLAARGHRRIAMVGPPTTTFERRMSFTERMVRGLREQSGLAGVQFSIAPTAARRDSVAAALAPVLEGPDRATALVVHHEAALPSVLDVLRDRHWTVPQDISVIAVCPPSIAEQQAAPLSSIDVPAQAIGAAAVDMAVAALRGGATSETRLVRAELTERGSTGAPPA
ncbi:LacI family DNA-binding transcriptional regulator [Ruania halotolerans]|uniref:LacI family DNA-binding transcriptional regulator n=1 Tax=Ruania halotolerans TaxID=2897773 RepID=UPI001E3D2B24|nr:LacI family DNA-binding transcriptional regulator [Ruania halotolerans]UFU07666.1 LacI family transcriptional regulator [Ruania halotolerans]